MTRVLTELPFRYAVLRRDRWRGPASAVHEPNPAGFPGRISPTAPAATSLLRHPPESSNTARVRLRLKPGQKGTKGLLAQYGDRLICVRYRYDAVEPSTPAVASDQIVGLRVAFSETAVRDRVKQAGGTWNPARKVWELRHDRVVALGLNHRIVDEPASTRGYQK